MKQIGIDDGIGYSSLILDAEKNETLGGAGTLAANDTSPNPQMLPVGNATEVTCFMYAHRIHTRAVIGHGMRPDGHACTVEVRDQAFFLIHGTQRGISVRFRQSVEQWAGIANGAFDLPQCVTA